MSIKRRKAGWLARITCRDDALRVVGDVSLAFLTVAVFHALMSILLGWTVLLDAFFYLAGAGMVYRFHSRAAAWCLLVSATVAAVGTFQNLFGDASPDGGRNVVLAVVVFWAAIRAVEATARLRGSLADISAAGAGRD